MPHAIVLPSFVPDQPAARVDAALREALAACDRARECAVLWFAEAQRRSLHRAFGYASLELYATEGLGFSLNRYWQFKRLADDLDRLPALREAVTTGDLGWTKAQQVARVATPETAAAWVMRAAATGRRELVREVRAARDEARAAARAAVTAGGEAAGAPSLFAGPAGRAAAAVPQVPPAHVEVGVTLRGDALQVARFEALVERAHKLGCAPAHAGRLELVIEALAALVEGAGAAAAVTSPEAAGIAPARGSVRGAVSQPPVQVVVQQCPDCGVAAVATQRGALRLAPAQVEALGCDARVRHVSGAKDAPGSLESHEMGHASPNRATIPPRVRAAALARDRHRCATPGCRATRFLEVHHVVARSAGGSNAAANLVTLCSRCHAHAHEMARRGGEARTAAGQDTCAGTSESESPGAVAR